MKIKFVFILMVFCSFSLKAQNDEMATLFSKNVELGYGGALVTKVGKVNNETGLFSGFRGVFLMDHDYSIGFGVYGLASNVKALNPNPEDPANMRMGMGYGGLELEYILSSNKLVHLTFQTLIGGGGVGYFKDMHHDHNDYEYDSHNEFKDFDSFFILEPGVTAELNVASFFKFGIGGSYRIASGLTSQVSTNSNLSGLSGFLTLKFGKF